VHVVGLDMEGQEADTGIPCEGQQAIVELLSDGLLQEGPACADTPNGVVMQRIGGVGAERAFDIRAEPVHGMVDHGAPPLRPQQSGRVEQDW
jgi:hypothetical protein